MFLSFLFKLQMSEQEKVVSENSSAESDQSSAKTRSNDDLEDVMNQNWLEMTPNLCGLVRL